MLPVVLHICFKLLVVFKKGAEVLAFTHTIINNLSTCAIFPLAHSSSGAFFQAVCVLDIPTNCNNTECPATNVEKCREMHFPCSEWLER